MLAANRVGGKVAVETWLQRDGDAELSRPAISFIFDAILTRCWEHFKLSLLSLKEKSLKFVVML